MDDLAAALIALTEAGMPPDVQEMLIYGNPNRGIPPGALRKALASRSSPEWQPIERTDEPCALCGEMTNSLAGNGALWPVWFCHADGTGISRAHHQKCVSRLIPVDPAGVEQDVRTT